MGDSDFMADSIEQVLTSETVAYTLLDTVMVPYPWYRGRVMIMGDAAHSMTPYLGSGAAMAIEDGVVFAQLLDSDDALYDVQQKFMARRYPAREDGLGSVALADARGVRLGDARSARTTPRVPA